MRIKLLALALVVAAVAVAGKPDRFAYIYKRGNDSIMRIDGSIEQFQRIAKRWTGEYIWVSRNGREYLIRDAAVLAAARKAFAPMEALEPQMREAEARMRPIERKYETIEERLDALEDDDAPESQIREAERALRAIESELAVAERAVERIEEELERREEVAEKKFEEIVLRAIDAGKAKRVD